MQIHCRAQRYLSWAHQDLAPYAERRVNKYNSLNMTELLFSVLFFLYCSRHSYMRDLQVHLSTYIPIHTSRILAPKLHSAGKKNKTNEDPDQTPRVDKLKEKNLLLTQRTRTGAIFWLYLTWLIWMRTKTPPRGNPLHFDENPLLFCHLLHYKTRKKMPYSRSIKQRTKQIVKFHSC